MTHFDPKHTHSYHRDYRTNVPSYYDYLAEQEVTINQVLEDINKALGTELAYSIELALDDATSKNLSIKKEEILPNRFKYTLTGLHDTDKENTLISKLRTIKVERGEDTSNIDIDPEGFKENTVQDGIIFDVDTLTGKLIVKPDYSKVQKKLVDSKTITVNDNKVEANFKTVQEKLQAGENIAIKGNVINAIGNANADYKQDKLNNWVDIAQIGDSIYNLPQDGVMVSVEPASCLNTGKYFIMGDSVSKNKADTPSGTKGFLFVTAIKGGSFVYQEFVPWDGSAKYFRTGTRRLKDSSFVSQEAIEDKPVVTSTYGEGANFWSDWQQVTLTSDLPANTKRSSTAYGNARLSTNNWRYRYRVRNTNSTATNAIRFISHQSNVHDVIGAATLKPNTRLLYENILTKSSNFTINRIMVSDIKTGQVQKVYDYPDDSINGVYGIYCTPRYVYVTCNANDFTGIARFDEVSQMVVKYDLLDKITQATNGSNTFIQGVTGTGENDNTLYITTIDRYTDNGEIVEHEGDKVRVYKYNTEEDTLEQLFGVEKWAKDCRATCLDKDGYIYISLTNTFDGSEDSIIRIYNTTGRLMNSITFTRQEDNVGDNTAKLNTRVIGLYNYPVENVGSDKDGYSVPQIGVKSGEELGVTDTTQYKYYMGITAYAAGYMNVNGYMQTYTQKAGNIQLPND